jgi:hypothetical protein
MATGAVAGILAFAGVAMLVQTLMRDAPGDTASPQLAALLAAAAVVVAAASVVVATAGPWSRGAGLALGVAGLVAGFGGLLYLIGASLIAAGMFPALLLRPTNLTVALVMALAGLTGIGLLMRPSRADPARTTGPRPVGSWYPVAVGIATGLAAAWIWGALIWPLIPDECCLL